MPGINVTLMSNTDTTDFGFENVPSLEKSRRVSNVFSSVANNYDLMNDLMSFGIHRLWKRIAVHYAAVKPGHCILDLATGTGDMALLYHERVGENGRIYASDVNRDMLLLGRNKMVDHGIIQGIHYLQANAECIPFQDNCFDRVSIAFGLRNVTDKDKALKSMFDKIKYGGCLIILEFSQLVLPGIKKLYDAYSLNVIPWIGKTVAKDENSYRYLVESIRRHPNQDTLMKMLQQAGFGKVEYFNLTGGIVAIHRAYKIRIFP